MSTTTYSPAAIVRSPGTACGSAPFSPAATIEVNEGSSAPSSLIFASAASATSRSVLPARPRSSMNE